MREFFDTNSLAEHVPPEEWQGVETEDDDEDVVTEPQASQPGAGGMSDAERAFVGMAADWREDLHPRGRGGRFRSKPKFFDFVSDSLHKGDVVSMDDRPEKPTYSRMDLIEAARAKGTLWEKVGKFSAADIMRVHGQLPEWAPTIQWDYGSDDQSYFIAPWEDSGSRVRGKPPRKFDDPMIGMHPLLVYPDMYKRGGAGSEDFDGKAQIKQQSKHVEGILNHELGHYMDYQVLSRMAGTDIGGQLMQRMNSLAEVSEAIVRENKEGEDLGFEDVLGQVLDSLMEQDKVMRGLERPGERLDNEDLIARYKERVVASGMPDVFQAIADSDWRKGVDDMLNGDWLTENIIEPVYQTEGSPNKGYRLADQISNYTQYLETASEEWAQAYQQFVAEFLAREFGDDRLRKDMIADAKERAKNKIGPGAKDLGISQEVMTRVAKIHARRWDDDDFEPIYQAMYRMFDNAGMLNGLRGQQKLFAERS